MRFDGFPPENWLSRWFQWVPHSLHYQALASVRLRLPAKRSSDVVDNIRRTTIGVVQIYHALVLFRFRELINIQCTMCDGKDTHKPDSIRVQVALGSLG